MPHVLQVGISAVIISLILAVGNWVYRKTLNRQVEYKSDQEFRRMSTSEMIEGLERILSDPNTSIEVQAKAKQQLETLRAKEQALSKSRA